MSASGITDLEDKKLSPPSPVSISVKDSEDNRNSVEKKKLMEEYKQLKQQLN